MGELARGDVVVFEFLTTSAKNKFASLIIGIIVWFEELMCSLI